MTPRNETESISQVKTKWELCDCRYVRWQIAVATIGASIALVISIAFAGGSWKKGLENRLEDIEGRCTRIESMQSSLDTINQNITHVRKLLQEMNHDR